MHKLTSIEYMRFSTGLLLLFFLQLFSGKYKILFKAQIYFLLHKSTDKIITKLECVRLVSNQHLLPRPLRFCDHTRPHHPHGHIPGGGPPGCAAIRTTWVRA